MSDNFDTTIQTYRDNFGKYTERTQSIPEGEFKEWMDSFLSQIPKGGEILEIGSATGRDARYFSQNGFKVLCTDIIPVALQNLKEEGFETAEFDFRDAPNPLWNDRFDGFFANAVLLHATENVFEQALRNAAMVLKKSGIAALTLKAGVGEEISMEKMDAPRFFQYYTLDKVREILNRLPFEIVEAKSTNDSKWIHVILRVVK